MPNEVHVEQHFRGTSAPWGAAHGSRSGGEHGRNLAHAEHDPALCLSICEPLPPRAVKIDDVPGFDASVPNPARVYDFLLGGRENFAADRELAGRLSRLVPHIRDIVQENKRFLARAVAWVAEQDVHQFIDLGSGLPTSPATHEVARAANPRASVTYVDNDPVVVNHLSTVPAVSVIKGDFRDVDAVLAGADTEAPVCLIAGCILHFFPAAEAADLLARYFAALAPGSYLIMSVICPVGGPGERGQQVYTDAAMPHYSHSAEEIAAFCCGFELVSPGVTDARCWRPGTRDVPAGEPRSGGVVLACVVRKP